MTNKLTKEEALKKVRGYLTDYFSITDYNEVEEIMLALEQQPCEDAISREEVRNIITKDNEMYGYSDRTHDLMEKILELPSVTSSYNSIKTELKPCEECISRQAAINAITKIHPIDAEYDCTLYDKLDVMCVLKDLPAVSIDPKQKDGMWIMDYRGRMKQCSECGVRFDTWSNELLYDNYCPRCGIPMKNDDITLEEEKNETNN